MPLLPLLAPRYWLLWLAIGLLWLLVQLPHRVKLWIGKQLGRLFQRFAHRRRHVATINITRCFPELSLIEQQHLINRHFESLGMGLLEMLSSWWLPDRRLQYLGKVEGIIYLEEALARGKGVILLSAHFTSLELGTRFLIMHLPVHATYRPHDNPLIEYFMQKNRNHHAEKAIRKNAVRDMVRSLKNNKPLWFAPDQNFSNKNKVFAPFFNILAATNTGTMRLAKMTGAAVVPFFTQRLEDGKGYKIILQPALTHFPSDDDVKDATDINRLIEMQIRCAPEQYLWVHRRFKERPLGEQDFY